MCLAVAILASGRVAALRAEPAKAPDAKALGLVRTLRASQMGVDRAGQLWAWDQRSAGVVLYSTGGTAVARASTAGAIAIDADGTWGVAEVTRDGFELRLQPWIGGAGAAIPLTYQASAVAWMGPQTVALGMATAAHRVELWNTGDKLMTRTLGTEVPVVRQAGLSRRRSYDIRYAPERDLLFTLESFTGDLQVFSLDGRLVRREQIRPGADRAAIEAWLQRLDRKGRETGEVEDPLIHWYWLALDNGGNAWVVSACDGIKGRAMLFEAAASGASKEIAVAEPCCSRALAIWGDRAIFYRDPGDPPESCNGLWRLP